MYHIFSGMAVNGGADFRADIMAREGDLRRVVVLSLLMCQICEGKKKIRSRATMVIVLADFNAESRFERNINSTVSL